MINPESSSEKFSDVKMGSSKEHETGIIEIKSDPIS